ncbi:MAG TPA: ribonuclease T2 [Hyphomicrobiaceae bacterium]|nr:ribonuclease T2 [Hyphomicrobiaceae bacterium]
MRAGLLSVLASRLKSLPPKGQNGWFGWALTTAAILLVAGAVSAQQRGPYGGSGRDDASSYQGGRPKVITQPGQFDYYTLALSWSPSYCASLPRDSYDPQCHRRDGKRYSFVLHGLWPQFERGWPEYCPSADRGFVPRPVANRMLDIMPSEKLVFHQYRKHGVCTGLGVDGYFDLSRKIFEKVTIPPQFVGLNDDRMWVSPQSVIQDFLKANPDMKADSIAVDCATPGPRLKEVRICFDKAGNYRPCGRNENQSRMCSANRIYVPPVRDGAGSQPRNYQGSGQRI